MKARLKPRRVLNGYIGTKTQGETNHPLIWNQSNPTVADPSGTGAEYQVDQTQSTRLRYQTLTENKGKTSSKVEPDHETLQLTTLADIQDYLLFENELAQESDGEEEFAAGDVMRYFSFGRHLDELHVT
ncbi:hypothetical protein Tco_0712552 [Tanacetum coccineum]